MIKEINDVASLYSLNSNSPGIACLIQKSDDVLYQSYIGYKDSSRNLITKDSKFRIASITKQFTAAAVLQLVERGSIHVDSYINTVMKDLGPCTELITIHQLLTHTSGIPDYEDFVHVQTGFNFSDADVYSEMSKDYKLNFEPGSSYSYSNTGYCLLAEVVRIVSGMSFKDYVESNVFPAGGMTNATVGPSNSPDRVYGFAAAESGWIFNDQSIFSSTHGDGGIYASVTDLVNWQQNLYQNLRVITQHSLKTMTTPYILTNYANEFYGYGIAVTEIAGETCYIHHGTSTGFENALFYIPNLKTSVALLANFNGTDLNIITVGKQLIEGNIQEFKN